MSEHNGGDAGRVDLELVSPNSSAGKQTRKRNTSLSRTQKSPRTASRSTPKDLDQPAQLFDLIPSVHDKEQLTADEISAKPFILVSDHEKFGITFKHFLEVDKLRDKDEAERKRMRESHTKKDLKDLRAEYARKLVSLLGHVEKVDSNLDLSDLTMFSSKWTENDYAFEDRVDFEVRKSALTGSGVMSSGKRINVMSSIIVSDRSFEGIHPSIEKHFPNKRSEDLHAVDSLWYGRNIGKYLHGATFERVVIGGDGALSNATDITFIDTTVVLPSGTYFFPNVRMEGTFRPDEKYRVDKAA